VFFSDPEEAGALGLTDGRTCVIRMVDDYLVLSTDRFELATSEHGG
jgi:hypothetical protein